MSTRTSTTNLESTEYVEPTVLEKIESQRAPGELTPVNASPALSTDGRIDDSKLEEGPDSKEAVGPNGKKIITHRPTGLRV
jgi:hypothetical protein